MDQPKRDRARRPGEFELIARYFRPLAAGREGALGLTDDAALIDIPAGRRLVVTADALVAGVHFLPEDPPDLIARKMLRVNLSDLAAMGATPLAYVMTCCFPATIDEAWLAGFAAGLAQDQREFDIALMGGDTTATPGPLTLSLTAIGTVATGQELRRSTARPAISSPSAAASAMPRSGLPCCAAAFRQGEGDGRPRVALPPAAAPHRPRPAPRGAAPQPAWTSPTGSPATSPISAKPRAWAR